MLLVLALPSVLLMADRTSEPGGAFVTQAAAKVGSQRDRVATRVAAPMQTEVFPLALFAIGGMMVFPAATDTVTLFVALEVLSLPLYLLCGLARRRRLISQESAVKYFLLGAFTSAIFVYGLALLYGYAGSTKFAAIASQARAGDSSDVLLIGGLALVLVGLLFKASVGPFHLWTPDVYQGAPTPITAFMASCTKVAAFAAMLRVCQVALEPMTWTWQPVLGVIAGASMVIGAVIGITQTDMKRMLAYSSVAHAGFILLGVLAMSEQGASATMFYLLTYGMATIGAFAILTVVRKGDGEASHVSDWAGLAKRSPVLAASMSLFLLSFAGIPLTAGFIGKLSVFTAAMQSGLRCPGGAGDGGDRGDGLLLPADRRGHVLLRAGHRAGPGAGRGGGRGRRWQRRCGRRCGVSGRSENGGDRCAICGGAGHPDGDRHRGRRDRHPRAWTLPGAGAGLAHRPDPHAVVTARLVAAWTGPRIFTCCVAHRRNWGATDLT